MNLGISAFFEDITNFMRAGSVMGLDIGTVSMKMLELQRKKNRYHLVNYCILDTREYLKHPNQSIQTSTLKIVETDAIEYLKLLLREMQPRTRLVVATLPAFSGFVTCIDMPLLSRDETNKAVMYQARQYIPVAISEVGVQWFKIEEFVNDRGAKFQRVLLVGVPNEVIKKYQSIVKGAGLKLVGIELEIFSLARAYLGSNTQPVMVLDIGGQASGMVVGANGSVLYTGTSDYGGSYLTSAVARGMDISAERAEELKQRRGLSRIGPDAELSTLIMPFLDVIITECAKVRSNFEERFQQKIQKIIITGGGSNLIGIEEYLGKQLGVPVSASPVISVFQHKPELEPIIKSLDAELGACAGAALRYFD